MQVCARQSTHVANVHHVVFENLTSLTSIVGCGRRLRCLREAVHSDVRTVKVAFNVHSSHSSPISPIQRAQPRYLCWYISYVQLEQQKYIILILPWCFVLRFQVLYATCSGTHVSWRSRARRLSVPVKQMQCTEAGEVPATACSVRGRLFEAEGSNALCTFPKLPCLAYLALGRSL
jgi:hypothetical protein